MDEAMLYKEHNMHKRVYGFYGCHFTAERKVKNEFCPL